MAGFGATEKKSSDGLNDMSMFNADNMQSNMKIILYSRTFLSIICGVIAGILGFTGLGGFIIYFAVMAITSVALAAKAKFSIHTYFDSWNRVLLDGFFGGLMAVMCNLPERRTYDSTGTAAAAVRQSRFLEQLPNLVYLRYVFPCDLW